MYSQKLLEHFHNPRNVGEIVEPTAEVEANNPICSDFMKLWIVVREGKVAEARFKVQGCVPAVACGSWLTVAITGKPVAEVAAITAEQVEAGLGGLPPASRHASALVIIALKKALEKAGQ